MSTRTAKLSEKKAETSIVLIVFGGVLCKVCAYIVTVSYCHSKWIRYQKSYILVSVQKYIQSMQSNCSNRTRISTI